MTNWFTRLFFNDEDLKTKNISKAITKKFHKFPCKDDTCLVRAACTQACDKLIMDDDKLMETFLKYNCCPDCGSEIFREGPSGGMSTNIRCVGCGHHFNMALPISIERIHVDSNGVFR